MALLPVQLAASVHKGSSLLPWILERKEEKRGAEDGTQW